MSAVRYARPSVVAVPVHRCAITGSERSWGHEAELVAVEDLAKPFRSPEEMRKMAQQRLCVQQSAHIAAQAAVTPKVPVAAPEISSVAEPQPTGIHIQTVYSTQGTHESSPLPSPKTRTEKSWLTRPIRGVRRSWPPIKAFPAQHTVSSGGYHILQDLDLAEEGPAATPDSSQASKPPQPEARIDPPTASSKQQSHSRR